jgi:hypothetical protein
MLPATITFAPLDGLPKPVPKQMEMPQTVLGPGLLRVSWFDAILILWVVFWIVIVYVETS